MSLFIVEVIVARTDKIAVLADSEKEALDYAKNNDEWREYGRFQNWDKYPTDSKIVIIGAKQADSPRDLPEHDGDCLCWNDEEETTIAEAFYSLKVPDCSSEEEEGRRAWDKYIDDRNACIKAYDKARKEE